MGVCPQHDILFPSLTVQEHLYLFAVFKGAPAATINQEVEQAIRDVDLWEKRFDYAKNLSGGQRRRLSVAIAFIGNSKLIYLDEPTSGMDTSARRCTTRPLFQSAHTQTQANLQAHIYSIFCRRTRTRFLHLPNSFALQTDSFAHLNCRRHLGDAEEIQEQSNYRIDHPFHGRGRLLG